MKERAIPVLTPDQFIRQFLDRAVWETIPPGEQTPNQFFRLMRIEDFVRHITFPIPASRSFHYDFMLVTGGTIERTYGLVSHKLEAGTFSAYPAGTIVSTNSCSPDATGYYALFDANYVLTTIKNSQALNELSFFGTDAVAPLSISPDVLPDWLAQLARISQALTSQRQDKLTYTSLLLFAFLLDVQQQYGQESPIVHSSATLLTNRFKQLLAQHIYTKRTVGDYADLLAVTPNHLNRCVKETLGKPASTLIATMLVLEAKVLLHQGSLSVAETAFRLSFDDASYFARFFKKHTGLSPSDFRQQA